MPTDYTGWGKYRTSFTITLITSIKGMAMVAKNTAQDPTDQFGATTLTIDGRQMTW